MAQLFTPFICKDLTVKNRIMMAPMCMYSAADDGICTPWHIVHYATRAQGTVGLLIQEATAVEQRGRITAQDLGIWSDEQIAPLKQLVDVVHEYGSKIGIQLGHAGRKGTAKPHQIIAPSAIAFSDDYDVPAEMTVTDIHEVILAFQDAARRVRLAGYDIIEIHAAHGYLINQFMSPLTNQRTDAYGGSLIGRARFLQEVIAAIRKEWPIEKPLMLRVSAEEYQENGNHPQEVADILNKVKALGVDLVNVSSGGVVPVPVPSYAGYQVQFAEMIRKQTKLPVVAGGLITDPHMAEEILQHQRADMIYLGRILLREPYWPLLADGVLQQELSWPRQYERGRPRQNGYR